MIMLFPIKAEIITHMGADNITTDVFHTLSDSRADAFDRCRFPSRRI